MSSSDTPTNIPDFPWINPIGGFGDMLMISGVLKQVHDRDSSRRFHLVRRTNYLTVLKRHPAIASVGHPPRGADFRRVDYWDMEPLGPGLQRPYQILAREFGLATPVSETLYLPGDTDDDDMLLSMIPWGDPTIAIAPASDSPRKVMASSLWHALVDLLHAHGCFVLQVGRMQDVHIRNAYCLLGLTTPHQLLSVLDRCTLVVTADNFIMHAAHLLAKPAVVLWGATLHGIYGYPEHRHVQMPRSCVIPLEEECVGRVHTENGLPYGSPCPERDRHCMNALPADRLMDIVREMLPAF